MEMPRDIDGPQEHAAPSPPIPHDIAGFFMESSFDAMLLIDGDGRIECTNSAAIRLLGRPQASMTGRPVADIVIQVLDPPPCNTVVKEAIAEFAGMLFTVRRADASAATVVLRKVDGPAGRQLWVLRDVTRHRPIAEALERKTRLLMEAQRLGKMGAWEFDADAGMLLFTEELQHMLGLVDSPVVSLEDASSLYADSSRAIVHEAFVAAMTLGTPYDLELEMRTARGDLIWVREVCRATRCDGRVVSLTGITQDITERRRMADLLARSADVERARIGANLHDGLGQELTGLALFLQGAARRVGREHPSLSRELSEMAAIAGKCIETVRETTHAMLPLELQQLGFVSVCQRLAASTQKSSGVQVKFRYLGDASHAPAGSSAEHMYRIVQEAIANALKHANPTRISVTLKSSAAKLVLTVSDNGGGIDLTRATSGVGLQIMRYRARLLGGLLDVRRTAGSGTMVRSVLPRCADSRI